MAQKRILVAPLNWGLGHATRCMPIINELIAQNATVLLASDGDAMHLLKVEYPELECLELPSYDIHYKGDNMFLNIMPQVPKILKTIQLERQKLNSIIQTHKIDIVLSDNRYGLYNKNIKSIFLTHQLNIQIPNKLVEKMVAKINRSLIKKFDECWIPDYEGEPNLSGVLAHETKLDSVSYLGALSRLEFETKKEKKEIEVLVVLSGPEPQRTYLEEKIIDQAQGLPYQFFIVGGRTDEKKSKQLCSNVKWQSFMTSVELQKAIANSKIIIARSGYSSLMDLVAMKCQKVLLVPTPGQTEQEYLAKKFKKENVFEYQEQRMLDLKKGIEILEKKEKIIFQFNKKNNLKPIIKNLLS